jgi:uncharacterized protein YybS (DUF2232 family)
MPAVVLVPLPGVMLGYRTDSAAIQGLWLFLTMILVLIGLGASAALGFVLPLGLVAVVLGTGLRREWSVEATIGSAVLCWSVGVLALGALTFGGLSALFEAIRAQLDTAVSMALSASRASTQDNAAIAAWANDRAAIVDGMLGMAPALITLAGAVAVLINIALVRRWMGGWAAVDLRRWRVPESWVWGLIAAGVASVASAELISLIGRNAVVVLLGVYFCQGIAVVAFYLERFGVPSALRVLAYGVIIMQQAATLAVLLLGVFDLWGNFRRLEHGRSDVGRASAGNEGG